MKIVIRHSSFVILIAALAALIPTYLIRFELLGIPTTLWEILLWLVVLAGLATGFLNLGFWRTDPLRWPLLLIFLGSFVGLVIAPDLRVALGQWKAIILDGLAFYWLVRTAYLLDGQIASHAIMRGLVLGGSLLSLTAVVLAPGLDQVAPDGRTISFYVLDPGASPNYLALYCAPLATLAWLTGLAAPTRRSQLIWLAQALILSLAVFLSGSRGGLVATTAGIFGGVSWWLGKRYPGYLFVVNITAFSLILLGALAVGPSFLPNPNVSRDAATRQTSSNNVRWEIWKTTVEILKLPQLPTANYQLPVWLAGVGFGNYQKVFAEVTAGRVNYPEYITPYALHPHNFFLMTWVTLGLVGLAGWLWLLLILSRRIVHLDPWQAPFLAAFVTWFVHGLVDTTFYKNDLAPLFWLIVAGGLIWTRAKPARHKLEKGAQ